MLKGKKGLIIGIANDSSIAWGCAQALQSYGAELAITYLNDKAKPYVLPLAQTLRASIVMQLDVTKPEEQEALFKKIAQEWGKLDFLIHSIAFAPKNDLIHRVVDCSSQGFLQAMDISCHSLIRLAKTAEPLMTQGGSILTMSYYGAKKVIPQYNIMGPVKAALESVVQYLAFELGKNAIRVNAISPGPLQTRAASGIVEFDALLANALQKSFLHESISLKQVGEMAAFLTSDKARQITGQTLYVDAGYSERG